MLEITDAYLVEIEARLNAATPGPWAKEDPDKSRDCRILCDDPNYLVAMAEDKNATLIANSPADIAALLAEVRRLRMELVKETRSHRKTLAHCKFEFDRAERAEAEKNILLMIAERFAPCPFVLFPDSDKRLYKEACGTCQPKRELRLACLREFAAQEAEKAKGE